MHAMSFREHVDAANAAARQHAELSIRLLQHAVDEMDVEWVGQAGCATAREPARFLF
jgi:hypothetical protein